MTPKSGHFGLFWAFFWPPFGRFTHEFEGEAPEKRSFPGKRALFGSILTPFFGFLEVLARISKTRSVLVTETDLGSRIWDPFWPGPGPDPRGSWLGPFGPTLAV